MSCGRGYSGKESTRERQVSVAHRSRKRRYSKVTVAESIRSKIFGKSWLDGGGGQQLGTLQLHRGSGRVKSVV